MLAVSLRMSMSSLLGVCPRSLLKLLSLRRILSTHWILSKIFRKSPQAGFKPPPVADTSYVADALPTKPPRLVLNYEN